MLNSFLNRVDSLLLTFYETKRDEAKQCLKKATTDLDALKQVHGALLFAKQSHWWGDVMKFNGSWIDLGKAEALLHAKDPCNLHRLTKEYEKYGTACAMTAQRMNVRTVKLSRSPINSRTASSL